MTMTVIVACLAFVLGAALGFCMADRNPHEDIVRHHDRPDKESHDVQK